MLNNSRVFVARCVQCHNGAASRTDEGGAAPSLKQARFMGKSLHMRRRLSNVCRGAHTPALTGMPTRECSVLSLASSEREFARRL